MFILSFHPYVFLKYGHDLPIYRARGSLQRQEVRVKHVLFFHLSRLYQKPVEYVLLTAITGALTSGLAGLMWPACSQLPAVFTQIAQALQVRP